MLDLEFDKYKDQRIMELYENLLNKRHVTVPKLRLLEHEVNLKFIYNVYAYQQVG